MFMKLDKNAVDLLCCPLCKNDVFQREDHFWCSNCNSQYPRRSVNVGDHLEYVYDFRLHRPTYAVPQSMRVWDEGQREYELFHEGESAQDSIESYLDEIDSVKEIYTQEFHLNGTLLDVGGHQGRLRYYLSPQDVPLYISIDPFLEVFENIQFQSNLLSAYAGLSEPCNFIVARAEELPFVANSFDWVHMRSVVDHFEDPFKAFKEAYRVLKPNGNLMIGLAIMEMITQLEAKTPTHAMGMLKQKIKGLIRLAQAVRETFSKTEIAEDHHIFRLSHVELRDLLLVTGFTINKEHWQKPPFNYVIYLNASVDKNIQAETAPQL